MEAVWLSATGVSHVSSPRTFVLDCTLVLARRHTNTLLGIEHALALQLTELDTGWRRGGDTLQWAGRLFLGLAFTFAADANARADAEG